MKRLMVFLNSKLCVGCHACETACKMENAVPAGPKWINVRSVNLQQVLGRWQIISRPIRCVHCSSKSPCERVCPVKAIKRTDDGIVTVDTPKCVGCKLCLLLCPFCVPAFNAHHQMTKCDFCYERLKRGVKPACVQACPMNALSFENASSLATKLRNSYIKKRLTYEIEDGREIVEWRSHGFIG